MARYRFYGQFRLPAIIRSKANGPAMHFGRFMQVSIHPTTNHVKNFQLQFFLGSFPGATNETLLQKFNSVHKDSQFYEKPQKKENAFIIRHYAGKVKYQVRVHQMQIKDQVMLACISM